MIAINEHVEINGISVLPVPLKDRKGQQKPAWMPRKKVHPGVKRQNL